MAHLCALCVRTCGSLRTVVRFHAGDFALLVLEIVHSRVRDFALLVSEIVHGRVILCHGSGHITVKFFLLKERKYYVW